LPCTEDGKRIKKEVEEHTFMIGTCVAFEALDEADKYEWQVGEDTTILTSKTFTLFLNSTQIATTTSVNVSLKAKNSPGSTCYPRRESPYLFEKKPVAHFGQVLWVD
jgi:hypothetical protein